MAEINRKSFVPLYYQLSELLREQIESRELKPGELAPSEYALCKKYHLSRNTVKQAVAKLVNEGLLYRHQGKGTFVAEKKTFHNLTTTLSFQAEVVGMKKFSETILKTAKEIVAPPSICKLLEIPGGSTVFFIQRIRNVDNQPFAFQTSYLPQSLCPGLLNRDLKHESLFKLLTEFYHHQISYADEILQCAKADKFESIALDINEGDSIFRLERKTRLQNNKIIEFVRTILPGTKCNIHIRLNNFTQIK